MTQVFLLLTNKTTQYFTEFYKQIFLSISLNDDCFALYHVKNNLTIKPEQNMLHFEFYDKILVEGKYFPIGYNLIPGNNHFPLLEFYSKYPNYDYYWLIEDDVRFSGDWKMFFKSFESIDVDFLTSHIRDSSDEPHWHWWSSLANPYKVISFSNRIRSFNPIYRISKKAIEFIHLSLINGWCGHHEVLFVTLLKNAGYTIADFGGTGIYVLPGFKNKFYIDGSDNVHGHLCEGTMRWRPPFSGVGEIVNKIYHPVKEK